MVVSTLSLSIPAIFFLVKSIFKPKGLVSLNTNHKHSRNDSLSDSSDKDYLRISVKKELGNPDGIVSNHLHANMSEGDILNIGVPSGEFVLKETNKPIVFIIGGIGVTPVISMFKEASKNPNKEFIFIQCVLNSGTHAFSNEIEQLLGGK